MTDPVIYENTKMDMGPGSLHFGGALTLSLGSGTGDCQHCSCSAKESEQRRRNHAHSRMLVTKPTSAPASSAVV